MSNYIILANLLASALSSAGPVLVERAASDAPGSVLPIQTSFPPLTASDVPQASSKGNFQWQIYGKCDENSKNIITKAWEESKQFVDVFTKRKPKGDYQAAVDMYMGTRSTYEDLQGYNFPKQIQDTISRMQGLYDQKSAYGNANLWVYCDEDSFWFKHCSETDTSAILAYEQEDEIFNNWYITFCPTFFNSNYGLSLDDKVKFIEDRNYNTEIMETVVGIPAIQAGIFFHEAMHMSQIVTSPVAVDYGYGAKYVYDLAKSKNTDAAVYNADSWTMTAQAIWAQIKYNLQSPPVPSDYYTGADAKTFGSGPSLTDVIYVDSAEVVPQGASAVPKGQAYKIDPSIWQVYTPGQGLAPLSSDSTGTSTTPSQSSSTSSPTPSSTPPPAADQCGDWYKFMLDHFEVYGKNFDGSKLGSDGSGLKKQIQGCGDLTSWHFDQKTNDPHGYQWYASGNLPIGTKDCVGHAVVSAGGASPDGCNGAG